jgi:hypothetical protein
MVLSYWHYPSVETDSAEREFIRILLEEKECDEIKFLINYIIAILVYLYGTTSWYITGISDNLRK